MVNFGQDLLIVAIVCAVATASFVIAYWVGSPVWGENFAIPELHAVTVGRLSFGSAEVGEFGNLAIIAGVLVLLLVLTPDANLYDVILAWRYWVGGLLLVGIAVVFGYTRYAVGKVRKEGRFAKATIAPTPENIAKLRYGYDFYVGYGVMVSMLILGIALVILMQLDIDATNFDRVAARIDVIFGQTRQIAGYGADAILGKFEVVFGQQRIAEGFILDEVNTLLMLLLCIMVAYTTVYRTRMRHVFAPAALTFLRNCIIGLVVLCAAYGCFVYFTKHLTFVDHVLAALRTYEATMSAAPWSLTQRYNEMVADLSRQRGIFGFLLALTTDRGGLILVIPLIQYLQPWKTPKDKKDKHAAPAETA